jgi:hypothetical protein
VLDVPSVNNIPGSRQTAQTWTDKSGDLWLFGGYGDDRLGQVGQLNDLWRFRAYPTAASPILSPPPGALGKSQTIRISDATSGSTVYYTLNDDTPTEKSSKYSGPIAITKKTNVKAIAVAKGYAPSTVVSGEYSIR